MDYMNDFIVHLITRLDPDKTDKDLETIERKLNAKGITIAPVLDEDASQKELRNYAKLLKSLIEQVEPSIKKSGIRKYMDAIQSELLAAQEAAAKQASGQALARSPEPAGAWEHPPSPEETMSAFSLWGEASGVYLNGFKAMAQGVFDIQTAMSGLYQVTDETDARYQRFLLSSLDNARVLGRSIASLIRQAEEWARLGYSFDQSEELSKTSAVYANLADVDDITAVTHMAAALKAFHLEAEQSVSVLDQLAALSSAFSIHPSDLGAALVESASAMSQANNDIRQTLAMIAGGSRINREAGDIGSALTITSARLHGLGGPAVGKDGDSPAGPKLASQVLSLTNGTVNIMDVLEPDKLKSTYEMLQDIASVWDQISEADQNALMDLLGGGGQVSDSLKALIEAFRSGDVLNAFETAANSSGAAAGAQDRFMGSFEARVQQLKTSFDELSETVLNSEVLDFFLNLGTAGVSALDGLIEKFKGLAALGLVGGGILGIKNVGRDKMCSLNRFVLNRRHLYVFSWIQEFSYNA